MRWFTSTTALTLLAIPGLGCTKEAPPPPPSAPIVAEGLWSTEGYGQVIDIGTDTVRGLEVTSVSCLPGFTGTRVPPPVGALAAFTLTEDPLTIALLPDGSSGRLRLHLDYAASDMIARRIAQRPAACNAATPGTPLSTFETFAATWAEHYPFFADKSTDWAAVVAAHRGKVTARTTPGELFAVLKDMIEPLHDAHSFIAAPTVNKEFGGYRKSASWVERGDRDKVYGLVKPYLSGPLHSFCEGRLEFGLLGTDIAYLRIRGFAGYTKDGAFEPGQAALEAALDTVFAAARGWKGLVVDVRINGGGADPYGLAIASRLTSTTYTAYAKQARGDPAKASVWTAEQPSVVRPSTRPGFAGPVVELIGIQSVSAAETFTQALLKRTPPVTRVGENTQGVFSDVLVRHLPNTWRFGLPNERFVTDGKTFDGAGIAPDVPVQSFHPAGIKSGKDAGLEKAVELLGGRKTQ